jgi:hypothetical protein
MVDVGQWVERGSLDVTVGMGETRRCRSWWDEVWGETTTTRVAPDGRRVEREEETDGWVVVELVTREGGGEEETGEERE